jgi:hypothetical protein
MRMGALIRGKMGQKSAIGAFSNKNTGFLYENSAIFPILRLFNII